MLCGFLRKNMQKLTSPAHLLHASSSLSNHFPIIMIGREYKNTQYSEVIIHQLCHANTVDKSLLNSDTLYSTPLGLYLASTNMDDLPRRMCASWTAGNFPLLSYTQNQLLCQLLSCISFSFLFLPWELGLPLVITQLLCNQLPCKYFLWNIIESAGLVQSKTVFSGK